MIESDLLTRLRHLAACRRALAEANAQRDAALAAWQDANAAIYAQAKACKDATALADAELRAVALDVYQQSGTKALARGVSIRMITHLDYDGDQALVWAKEHKLALALDRRAFEHIALVAPDEVAALVERRQEPQVFIATDLEKALRG